jgi:alpha-L-fucosidase
MKSLPNAWILVASLLTPLADGAAPETATATWPPADPAAIARWQAKKFGMFIHFGPVSLTGKGIGWSRGAETPIGIYDNLYKRFNPSNFNAEAWVSIARTAGMKYIVLTTKHHDGFCLWDTKFSDYNIMKTPFHRDVVAELAAACKQQGMAFGAYYSTCDWWHPDFPLTSPGGSVKREKSDLDAYNRYLLSQVGELITKYGPLLTIWNDVPQCFKGRGAQTIRLVRSLQPDSLINDRTGDGGDYDTPEQHVGKYQDARPWETCMTICEQWSWKPNDKMKSLEQCLRTLVRCAGGDGNLLFNVGPMPTGEIEPRQVERLKEIGAWLTKNGESIYSTRGGPWKPNRSVASTRKDHTIYVHILESKAEAVELPDIPRKVLYATLLNGDKIQFLQKNGKLSLIVPAAKHQPIETIVELELDRSAMDVPAREIPPDFRATASNVYHNQMAEYGPQFAFDGDPDTRWATDAGERQAWIAVSLNSSRTVQSVTIREAYDRVRKFEFQYRDGENWKTIFTGTTLGERFGRRFGPITAREFRLNILEATDGPTISEIELSEN